jgi:phosphoglycolate phosphatase-like HAD superfamily hydrolase
MDYQKSLKDLKPSHEYFIGIDSDGCVFDSMEVKQKEFFIPNALKCFDLFAISRLVRETWEFVNLYSTYRGVNRFPAMIKVFDLLAERNEVRASGCKLPDFSYLKEWVTKETKLSNANLRKHYESNPDPDLEKVVIWTEAVNQDIGEWLHDIPAFIDSMKTIEKIASFADSIVVSQTPLDALKREWEEHDLKKFVRLIAGQEHGTKAEHITFAAKSKYPDDKILLIGDALSDLDAAKDNGVLFYPVIPGREDNSWKRLLDEGLEQFVKGTFEGNYEDSLINEFRKSLPDTPPWKR